MEQHELKALFDQQAAGYDQQWARMAPIRDCLHFLLDAVFAELPPEASVLCVGAGTGAEIGHLARRFPRWRFMAVDPSSAMIDVCRERARSEGFLSRCSFHRGYVDTLPPDARYDAATSFLVSQFILAQDERTAYFRAIAGRLHPGGVMACSDLASDTGSPQYEALLRTWLKTMAQGGVPSDGLERMRAAYAKDVAILPPATVAAIITAAGFESPASFFQAGLIHGWFARRADP